MDCMWLNCEYCLGLDSDLADIMDSDLEGRPDTNCYLEESWESQGTAFINICFGCAWGGCTMYLCLKNVM